MGSLNASFSWEWETCLACTINCLLRAYVDTWKGTEGKFLPFQKKRKGEKSQYGTVVNYKPDVVSRNYFSLSSSTSSPLVPLK
jgi:hypothetical protein